MPRLITAKRIEFSANLFICIEIKPLREYCRSVYGELSFVFIEAEIISGEPRLSVHEEMRWVKQEELTRFEWRPADKPVAEKLSQ